MALTTGEQLTLARLLGSKATFVQADNIAPLALNDFIINPIYARDLVLSMLLETADIGCGGAEHGESSAGGTAPGTTSGTDNI